MDKDLFCLPATDFQMFPPLKEAHVNEVEESGEQTKEVKYVFSYKPGPCP